MIASKYLKGTGLALALAATGVFAAEYGSAPQRGTSTAQETKPGMTQSGTTTGSPPSSTQAGTDATKAPMTFDQLDKNHDGYIDKSEAAAVPGLSGVFDKYDKSKTGKLDRAGFDQATRELAQK